MTRSRTKNRGDKVVAILNANLAELEFLEAVGAARPGTRESILAIHHLLALRKSRRAGGPRRGEKSVGRPLLKHPVPRGLLSIVQASWRGPL